MSRIRFAKEKVAEHEALANLVEKHLLERGGETMPFFKGDRRWAINTNLGRLTVSVSLAIYDEHKKLYFVGDLLTIFCRFENVTRAREQLRGEMNPYSGKWNHNGGCVSEGGKAEDLFNEWARRLAPLLREVAA